MNLLDDDSHRTSSLINCHRIETSVLNCAGLFLSDAKIFSGRPPAKTVASPLLLSILIRFASSLPQSMAAESNSDGTNISLLGSTLYARNRIFSPTVNVGFSGMITIVGGFTWTLILAL